MQNLFLLVVSVVANSGTLALKYAAYGCPSKLHELHLI